MAHPSKLSLSPLPSCEQNQMIHQELTFSHANWQQKSFKEMGPYIPHPLPNSYLQFLFSLTIHNTKMQNKTRLLVLPMILANLVSHQQEDRVEREGSASRRGWPSVSQRTLRMGSFQTPSAVTAYVFLGLQHHSKEARVRTLPSRVFFLSSVLPSPKWYIKS